MYTIRVLQGFLVIAPPFLSPFLFLSAPLFRMRSSPPLIPPKMDASCTYGPLYGTCDDVGPGTPVVLVLARLLLLHYMFGPNRVTYERVSMAENIECQRVKYMADNVTFAVRAK